MADNPELEALRNLILKAHTTRSIFPHRGENNLLPFQIDRAQRDVHRKLQFLLRPRRCPADLCPIGRVVEGREIHSRALRGRSGNAPQSKNRGSCPPDRMLHSRTTARPVDSFELMSFQLMASEPVSNSALARRRSLL